LLRVTRTDIHTLDVALPAFIQQGSSNILPDVIPNEIHRNPIPATEIHERKPNLGAGSERKDITPMGNQIEVSLTISIL
jgi:hypothetical protein